MYLYMYFFEIKNAMVKFCVPNVSNEDLTLINFRVSSWYYRNTISIIKHQIRQSDEEKREEDTALRRYLRRSLRIKDTVIILTSHR